MRILLALVTAAMLATPASAQESYKQVWVTQTGSGEIVRGRLLDLSDRTLALLTADNRRVEMPIDRVLRIEVRGDSLKNGAAIGAAVMGGLSLLSCAGYRNGGACAAGTTINVALGALIGAGIDAMNGGRTAIYTKPAAPEAPSGKAARLQLKLRF